MEPSFNTQHSTPNIPYKGIYIHIPFCKQKCHYCNFHFSTSRRLQPQMVEALVRELEMQQDYLEGAKVGSIYLGGGTPSLLTPEELDRLFATIHRLHSVDAGAEITLEANPDDITPKTLQFWKSIGINRLSVGIQSFHDIDLQWMNRAHDSRQARQCLEWIAASGIPQLTMDLIYGSPTTSMQAWQANLDVFFQYNIPHLSAYCLTVEPRTALAGMIRKGKSDAPDDELATEQFLFLMDCMDASGYDHYEISNFGKPGQHARHNTSYWQGIPYLGIGPSAHSYNGTTRQWNVAHNPQYIKAIIEEEKIPYEQETLDLPTHYNEYIMTGLRTMWGISINRIKENYNEYFALFSQELHRLSQERLVKINDDLVVLTRAGKLQADGVAARLFMV